MSLIFLMMVNFLAAQETVTGSWTWIKGSDLPNDTGSYGQLGEPSATNNPRSRSGALIWTDANGIAWMYGGFSFCEYQCSPITLNDFWTYDPTSNTWTWIAGSKPPVQNTAVVYGQQGVPAPANNPGPRAGCFSWTPPDGKFWFYDPAGCEIWNYNPVSSYWTWISGKKTSPNPSYGIKGVPSRSNKPGILGNPSCWKDKNGNLWVFGDQSNGDVMWMFDITTYDWAWIKGDTIQVPSPRYGTYRMEDPSNTPGSLSDAFTWTDNKGDFWGLGGLLNELWKFNFTTKNWVWMKEAGAGYPETSYGIKGREAEANNPGERWNGVTWVDSQNNLWMMGGTAYHTTLDELWRFNTTTLQWAWVRGAEEPASYGIMGVTSPSNQPPRRSQASVWTDKTGNLWMMGGLYVPRVGPYLCYNDLWSFSPNGMILAQNALSFNASRVGSNALLSWKSVVETGIAGYNIQRQDDGFTAFKNIGYMASKTPSGQLPVYTYTDLNLSSRATYYRLQLLHTNGEISYSDTRMIRGLDQQDNITIYPNPSAGQLINIQFTAAGPRNISLTAVNGVIMKRWFNYNASLLQLQNLQAGTYLLRVENQKSKLVQSKKIVVVK